MKFTKKVTKYTRGFTLIELLVVIAIIGILSSIVLASLSSARSKGNDSKVQEQMNSLKSAMEIYYSSNSSYSSSTSAQVNGNASTSAGLGSVNSGTPFNDNTSGLVSLVGTSSLTAWPSGTTIRFNIAPAGTAYAAAANLSSGAAWCVDSTGVSKSEASGLTAVGSLNQCP